MRWDKDYKNPEVINDPTIIPAYGVTDEERARWNAKQDALEYDAEPTPYSDKLMISGAIFNALERYKVQTVEASKAFFWGVAEGLGQTQAVCEAAKEICETAQEATETAAAVSNTNRLASENSARIASEARQVASEKANDAQYSRLEAEAWAIGRRNGVPVEPDDPAYHHNAKYYADLTREVIDDEVVSSIYTWSSEKLSGILDIKADLVDGKVPAAQLPSYVDDVIEYTSISEFPVTGESGKIYIDTTTGLQYRWSGSGYAIISESLALGETSSTAYAGDKGKQNADNISALQSSVSTIEEKIPSTASSSNQLATNADLPTALVELTDDATHRLVTDTEKTDWNSKAAGNHNHDDRYSQLGHIHDDRYYTETEIDTLLSGKSDTTHTHDDRYYTETETDTLLNGKSNTGHTHDDRYYTESEVDTLLNGKANTVHNHDDRYYTEAEIDAMFAGVSFTTSGGDIYINW